MHKVCLYISPNDGRNFGGDIVDQDLESSGIVPWWMKNRCSNKVTHCKGQSKTKSRKEEEAVLNVKNLGIMNSESKMDSCFPPLGALSIRDSKKSIGLSRESRKSVTGTLKNSSLDNEFNKNGKIEVLQDLDLYYIRQIAHNLKEYDLEQKIDLEIKMREGTTKLLAACKHRAQSLEAAKNLLTSNERMFAYMSELQRRKKETPSRELGYPKISKARLSLSDLRMPLIWRDTDHFKNKGDYRRFAVFCLARVGTEIYDTSLLSPVDRSLTDLTFPDVMLFGNVGPDFELRLEVYSHILQDDLTMASTSRKIKKTIHSSISRTVGKKLAATLSDELNAGKIGPRFELIATAKLTLDEVHDSIRTHDLQIQTTATRSHQLPLFGHFCCRLAAQPNAFTQEAHSGELSVRFHNADEDRLWESAWGRLQGFNLEVWKQRKFHEADQPPSEVLPINKNVTIKTGQHSTEILIISNNSQVPMATLRLQDVEEQQKWLKCLNQQAEDHRRWRNAAENCWNIMSPGSIRNSFVKCFRQGSLYDQTPIIETIAPEPLSHRRTVQEIFGLTPSTSLSSCASSSSLTLQEKANTALRRTANNNHRLIPN